MKQKLINKQECIPVRCVPAALYRTGGLCPGRVSVQGDLCPRGGLCPGGVSVQGGLCPGRSLSKVGLCPGGVLMGGALSRETPFPMDRQTPVKILACPNFVCGRQQRNGTPSNPSYRQYSKIMKTMKVHT